MNKTVLGIIENKENTISLLKPRVSIQNQRTFGTDLTKSLPSIPASPDPIYLDYYSSDIYKYLFATERQYTAVAGYMNFQSDITERMRAILIDWLIDVHRKFKLGNETLYLTVNIIDRYLQKTPLSKNRLQLVGVTALLVASKYEDIYPPEILELVYITDKAYTREEILDMEKSILKQLEYNITVPSSYRFLERFSRVASLTECQSTFAMYLIELTLVDYKMIKYPNSLIAASAVYLMHKIKSIKPEWGEELINASPYKEEDLKGCAKDICMLFQNIEKSSLKGAKNKFASARFFHVANTPIM